jgi:hypothetical protein
MMTDRVPDSPSPESTAQFCRFWCAQVDALESHLNTNTWIAAAIAGALIALPVIRIVVPGMLHGMVPDVVWNVLRLL